MDNLMCDGSETELGQCRFDGWAHNDCDSSEAAGVVCKQPASAAKPIPISHPKKSPPKKRHLHKHRTVRFRLAGGRVPTEGRVEVKLGSNAWGTVCGDGWSLLEANVLCKSLGLGYANDALQTDFFRPPSSRVENMKMVLSGTECLGNETSLRECVHHGGVSCPGPRDHVAAVTCVRKMADLVFQHVVLEQSAHLEDRPMYYLQCAMEENCLASQAYREQRENPNWRHETRRLLKFTATVLNDGTDDFRPSIPKHLWEWHMCHMYVLAMVIGYTYSIALIIECYIYNTID